MGYSKRNDSGARVIFFATPCHKATDEALRGIHRWCAETAQALSIQGAELGVVSNCPWIDAARSDLVARFMRSSCSWLFFRDDDNFIEPSTLGRMMKLDKPLIIVPYRSRLEPHDWTFQTNASGEIIRAGLGLTLIHRKVIVALYKAHPELEFIQSDGCRAFALFQHEIALIDGVRRLLKEDHTFFARARRAGYRIAALEGAEATHGSTKSIFKAG